VKSLARDILDFPSLLLFFDYDGTLVPLQPKPGMSRLHPHRRTILAEIARRHRTAVVSGRSLSDVRSLVGLPRIAFAGNHGLEIQIGRTHWVHPEAEETALLLSQIIKEADFRLKSIPGIHVENKRLTASVHFRQAKLGDEPEIRRILRRLVPSGDGPVRLTEGAKVIEIRPAVDWDKGHAVLFMAALMDPKAKALPLYFGDDRTDEDAFQALAGRGITVFIGRKKRTDARYRLPDVGAVWSFIRTLLLL